MAKYGAQFLKPITATNVGVASLEAPGSGPRRITLDELIVGSDSTTLGTSNFRWDVQRSTGPATGTPVIPEPLDTVDVPCGALVKSNLTANGAPAAGKIPLSIPLSQQATFRWVANPGFGIIVPATGGAGLHLLTPVAGNSANAAGSLIFEE
jgi:hypothetical protein